MTDVLLSHDARRRGITPSNFKIICSCGLVRWYQFTKKTWDIFPCSRCKAEGSTNKDLIDNQIEWLSIGEIKERYPPLKGEEEL